MKSMHIISGLVIALSVTACADKTDVPVGALKAPGISANVAQPVISGAVFVRQRIALPENAVLTVTLSDASNGTGPTRVIAQKVQKISGQQAPLHYKLPFNGRDVNPQGQVLLSAAITLDGRVIFASESLQPVTAGITQRKDLMLVAVPQVAVPVAAPASAPVAP
ncbi:YbaY family lipoprotein [Tatumella sp. UBA2305]|uniref:YbaY family lipoprotein n=1 Tax=Tatumella sp. UBA2305 TaxID=1947647 RepID=UPI0025F5FCFA|nr:YbaY family lipoprotein [Tatumella sp. UBA2305]